MDMLTENQKEAFRKIKKKTKVEDGGLNAKQKGDFYYRMSKILKEDLGGLDDLVFLLNELPDSYLEKINLSETADSAMRLMEKLVDKVNPTVIVNGKAVQIFKIKRPSFVPGINEFIVNVKVTYTPTNEGKCFLDRLANHIKRMEATTSPTKDSHIYTPEEFTDEFLAKRIGWKWSPERGLIIEPGHEITEETEPDPGTDENLLILNALLQARYLGNPVPKGQIEKLMKLCHVEPPGDLT